MVRTIGRIIGCITTFLSSAQSGGRTYMEFNLQYIQSKEAKAI
jgi:hypothetical protein